MAQPFAPEAVEDAETVPDGTVLRADVAIIGAGPAGITVARELAGTSLDTMVIESGGTERDELFQELHRGEIAGMPYWPLDGNRVRCLGGTTKLWAGWCRPLDELDFAVREWVPHSGWPISRESLVPFYRKAHEICQLDRFDYDLPTWERLKGAQRLPLDGGITTKMFQLSPPTDFGHEYVPDLVRAPNLRVLTRATVLEIEEKPGTDLVHALNVGTLGGRRFRVEAKMFVLAAGGLENARLLLLSQGRRPAGLGNEHDQVGRYFMEHPHFSFGGARVRGSRQTLKRLYFPYGAETAIGRLFIDPKVQRERGLLQGNVMLAPDPRPGATRWRRRVDRVVERSSRNTLVRFAHTLEQPPDPANRVVLGDELDAFGLRRIRLEWRMGEMERATFLANWSMVRSAMTSAGIATASTGADEAEEAWPPDELQGLRGHHMGTTRMSHDPKNGVVDGDCRVHSTANLFVAGSSVFPTAGAGTPTLTIIALAVRLAEHLRSRT